MNLNDLARQVSIEDDGNINADIATIKRIIKIVCVKMFNNPSLIAKMILNGSRHS